jgi:hypothetical protein
VADIPWVILTAALFVLGLHVTQAAREAANLTGTFLGFALATALLAGAIFTGLEVTGG